MRQRKRGRGKRWNPYRQMKIRCYVQKKDHIYETFYTNLMVNKKHKSREETLNIKKRGNWKDITEYHQTKMADRNTRKEWRCRATRKQKNIKW